MNINIINGRKTSNFSKSPKVLVDVYRSTSTMPIMLKQGARYIIPVGTVAAAKKLKEEHSDYIIAGERYGFKIPGFDMSNSPYESANTDFANRVVIFTSTNGTKVLQKIKESELIMVASFVNIDSTVNKILELNPENLDIVTSGRPDGEADEDLYFAIALKGSLEGNVNMVDEYINKTREGKGTKRLSMIGGARDVEYSLKRDFANFPVVYHKGIIEKM